MLASMLYQKKKQKKKPTLTLQVFNVGYNPTLLYILKRQRCSKLGLHDKPTLTLKFQCWLQCSKYQTQTNNDISSPFSILGSIPHHYTYMKGHVSNVGFNTDTKSLRYWFSSLLKQVFTAKFVQEIIIHQKQTILFIYAHWCHLFCN